MTCFCGWLSFSLLIIDSIFKLKTVKRKMKMVHALALVIFAYLQMSALGVKDYEIILSFDHDVDVLSGEIDISNIQIKLISVDKISDEPETDDSVDQLEDRDTPSEVTTDVDKVPDVFVEQVEKPETTMLVTPDSRFEEFQNPSSDSSTTDMFITTVPEQTTTTSTTNLTTDIPVDQTETTMLVTSNSRFEEFPNPSSDTSNITTDVLTTNVPEQPTTISTTNLTVTTTTDIPIEQPETTMLVTPDSRFEEEFQNHSLDNSIITTDVLTTNVPVTTTTDIPVELQETTILVTPESRFEELQNRSLDSSNATTDMLTTNILKHTTETQSETFTQKGVEEITQPTTTTPGRASESQLTTTSVNQISLLPLIEPTGNDVPCSLDHQENCVYTWLSNTPIPCIETIEGSKICCPRPISDDDLAITLLEHPKFNVCYYGCYRGMATLEFCPPNTEFNLAEQRCKLKDIPWYIGYPFGK